MRGATALARTPYNTSKISIHAPHAGSDASASDLYNGMKISIHAPHAGSDSSTVATTGNASEFQSTLPMRGATAISCSFINDSGSLQRAQSQKNANAAEFSNI